MRLAQKVVCVGTCLEIQDLTLCQRPRGLVHTYQRPKRLSNTELNYSTWIAVAIVEEGIEKSGVVVLNLWAA